MNIKKKAIALITVVGLALTLSACTNEEAVKDDKQAVIKAYTELSAEMLSLTPEQAGELVLPSDPAVEVSKKDKEALVKNFETTAPKSAKLLQLDGLNLDEKALAISKLASVRLNIIDETPVIRIPEGAVTIEGDKATIDRSKVIVRSAEEGAGRPTAGNATEERGRRAPVRLVKEEGKWHVVTSDDLLAEVLG